MRADNNIGYSDGLTHHQLHGTPTHVHCGACLDGEVPFDEAKLVEFKPGQHAYICRHCLGSYHEVVDTIKPLKFYSA